MEHLFLSLEQHPDVLLSSVDVEPEVVFVTNKDQNSLYFVNTLWQGRDFYLYVSCMSIIVFEVVLANHNQL